MTSAFVDNLLKHVTAQGARGLRFEVGKAAVVMDASGGTRNVTTRTLTQQDILDTILPIVPTQTRGSVLTSPSVEFAYTVPALGAFLVHIVNAERLVVSISQAKDADGSSKEPPVTTRAERPVPPLDAAAPRQISEPTIAPTLTHASTPAVTATPTPLAAPAPAPTPGAVLRQSADGHVAGAPPIDRLFQAMCAQKASDLHISAGMPPLVRRDGEIRLLEESATALSPSDIEQLLQPITPEKNREEFERRHDTDFAYEVPGLGRFRANVFMDRKGRGAVFRVIPSKILTADDLGLSPQILQLCHLNKGLVLVTGPTGSGKSTTLCAMIDYINRMRSDHIITIEDPIEFVHENKKCLINQREVHTHTSSFRDALRASLREDPDIILVGEMRDLETVAIAIETAETGHLVFGTLHTTTAASTVDRVIDQFPTDRQAQIRIMLSESLKGVIAQTLCKKTGGGRAAALEVLIVTSAISNLIREAKTFQIPSMMQVGKAIGMATLNDALLDLVTKKLVEPAEAYAKSVDKTAFEGLLKRAGFDTKFVQASPN
jgi:twitching motility protein PilT